MHMHDLGELSGSVMAFGGPYSNLSALRAMRQEALALGIARAHTVCTGDVVAYCAQAAETVAEIRDWGIAVVAGNCEIQLAQDALDCGCGFDAGTTCDLLSAGWYAHANAACGPEERGWMATCPNYLTFDHAGRRVAVIHGGTRDVSRFIWPVSDEEVFAEEIGFLREKVGRVDVIIAGHSGIPFVRQIAGCTWINAGVIGMPPHDGRTDTRFAILHADGTPEIRTLSYDSTPTIDAMRQAGLTQGYDTALKTGWWPSEDVLPAALRRSGHQSRAIG